MKYDKNVQAIEDFNLVGPGAQLVIPEKEPNPDSNMPAPQLQLQYQIQVMLNTLNCEKKK